MLFHSLPLIELHNEPMHVFDSHILFRSFSDLRYKIIGFVPCHSLDHLCIADSTRLCSPILLLFASFFYRRSLGSPFFPFFVALLRLDSLCMG